jgi:CRISPR system Cascade subunit CasA
MKQFNLTTDPFIPVTTIAGTAELLNLRDVFASGAEIKDLAVRPHERVALLRLLICIAQAASQGPCDDDALEWEQAEREIGKQATDYLAKWKTSFELFGEGARFLQLRTAKTEETQMSKLFFHLASGNTHTVFDHAGGEDRTFPAPELALGLVTFQSFSPLIGRGYTGRGPCVDRNALHVFRQGASLLSTILMNSVSIELAKQAGREFGRPVWEKPFSNPQDEKCESVVNATQTYLGRLVPMARSLWLADDRRHFILDNGPDYPAFDSGWREPSATESINKVGKNYLLSANLERATWRELDAIALHRASQALTLRRIDPEDDQPQHIWAGGMVTDYKAKIDDVIESRFQGDLAVPSVLFSENPAANLTYQGGVQAADAWQNAARFAASVYAESLKYDDKKTSALRDATSFHFWSRIEHHLPLLFSLAREPSLLAGARSADPYAKTAWHQALRQVAHEAFNAACPQDNGRQHEAAGWGLNKLRAKSLDTEKKRQAKKAAKKAKA